MSESLCSESVVVPILDIKEEFATCEICLEDFDNDRRSPRTLPCFHSLCCDCLEQIWNNLPQGVQCPTCRQAWPVQGTIKETFPQNKILTNLVEYIELKNKPEDVLCWQCPNKSNAVIRCLECQQYMCELCAACHKKFPFSEKHKTVSIADLITTPLEYFQQKSVCKIHDGMKLDVFCKADGCHTPVCTTCVILSHRDHDICNVKEVYNMKKDMINSSLDDMNRRTKACTAYKDELVQQNSRLETVQQQLIEDIDTRYHQIQLKVQESKEKVKSLVLQNITEQKKEREEQIRLVEESETLKSAHALYCHQAVAFARDVDFIDMSQSLEEKIKSLTGIPKLPDLKVQEIALEADAYERLEQSREAISLRIETRNDGARVSSLTSQDQALPTDGLNCSRTLRQQTNEYPEQSSSDHGRHQNMSNRKIKEIKKREIKWRKINKNTDGTKTFDYFFPETQVDEPSTQMSSSDESEPEQEKMSNRTKKKREKDRLTIDGADGVKTFDYLGPRYNRLKKKNTSGELKSGCQQSRWRNSRLH